MLTSTTPVPIMRVPSGGGVATHHDIGAGWSSLVARRAHNPKVVGSNPAPATKFFLVGHKLLCQAVMEMVEKID